MVVTLVAATGFSLWSADQVRDYAHDRAGWLANLSTQRAIDPIIGYQAATLLDPHEPSYRAELAQIYLAGQKPDKALEALQGPENGSDGQTISIIRSKALVELNRGAEAAQLPTDTEAAQLQQALALAANGRAQSISLNKTLMSGEGRGRLARIQAGGLPLAQELNAQAMPQAALRLLDSLPNDSTLKFQLIAQIKLARPQATSGDLTSALEATTQGLTVDPASLPLYRLRLQILQRQGAKDDVAAVTERIQRLESGRF
jgi:predicted negative regulator of RcsB-dependent stress response